MKNKDLHVFARTTSEDGSSGSSIIISDASITIGAITKKVLRNPVEISTGKTKNKEGKAGYALLSVSTENPDISYVESSGTGRVESVSIGFPKLALGTKKNRKASNKGLYAKLRIKSEIDNSSLEKIEYFDLVLGKTSDISRDNAPHFGFRPNSSAHFYVKTNELEAEHRSYGSIVFGSSLVLPKKIVITCKRVNAEVVIKFRCDQKTNSIVAESICIV